MRLLALATAATVALAVAVAFAGCGGDKADADAERAKRYALRIERITDRLQDRSARALIVVNRLNSGAVSGAVAARRLQAFVKLVERDAEVLEATVAPERAKLTHTLLEDAVDRLASDTRSTATDVRIARRGERFFAQTRLLSAETSAVSALGLATRVAAR